VISRQATASGASGAALRDTVTPALVAASAKIGISARRPELGAIDGAMEHDQLAPQGQILSAQGCSDGEQRLDERPGETDNALRFASVNLLRGEILSRGCLPASDVSAAESGWTEFSAGTAISSQCKTISYESRFSGEM
jgi:hypothetical protein